jgi:hypothetical protein
MKLEKRHEEQIEASRSAEKLLKKQEKALKRGMIVNDFDAYEIDKACSLLMQDSY